MTASLPAPPSSGLNASESVISVAPATVGGTASRDGVATVGCVQPVHSKPVHQRVSAVPHGSAYQPAPVVISPHSPPGKPPDDLGVGL